MGFSTTTLEQPKPHRETSTCAPKTASRKFFSYPIKTALKNQCNPLKTQQEKLTLPIKTASGVFYYKYRHYSPELGRWPSRDPIEEDGGVNLYALVGNDPVGRWDLLGLSGSIMDLTPEDIIRAQTISSKDCEVRIEIGHGLNWDSYNVARHKKVRQALGLKRGELPYIWNNRIDPSHRVGVIGCGHCMDKFNSHLNDMGAGVSGMPQTNGGYVGPSTVPSDDDDNGQYVNGPNGWHDLVDHAWKAALKEAENLCENEKLCCEKVKVHVVCDAAAAKFGDGWCGRTKMIDCKK